MADQKKSVFEILNSINVNDHTEQKNGLTYLSWAWAWQIVKTYYPNSYYTIYERNAMIDGCEAPINYFTDGKTCWVKTGVTIVDGDWSLECIEELPVMDFKNKSIPLDSVTSTDVNKAIQRSITKCLSRHGLACYIYAGEDMPEENKESLTTVMNAVSEKITALTSKMEKEQKIDFANKVVIPIIGSPAYKACKDVDKLTKLLEAMNNYKN